MIFEVADDTSNVPDELTRLLSFYWNAFIEELVGKHRKKKRRKNRK